MRISIALVIFLMFSPVWAQTEYDLSPEALAFCLDQSGELTRVDLEIEHLTDRRQELGAIGQEFQLRLRTLRDTARVDARVATQYRALQLERARLAKAQDEAALQLDENLLQRQDIGRNFERICVGRSYSADDLAEAEKMREKP